MRSRRLALAAVIALGVVAAIVLPASPALASCHAFTVSANPATVVEGASVTVTVSRDGTAMASRISIETINETAIANGDYSGTVAPLQLLFTDDTKQTITVTTVDDAETEEPETFRLHLSNPGGCSAGAGQVNYSVGPDAQVTINDNDVAATTTTTAPTSTSKATTSASSAASTSTSNTTSASSVDTNASGRSTSDSGSGVAAAATKSDSGGGSTGTVIIVLLVVLAALAAGGAAFVVRRRGGVTPSDGA